MELLQWGPGHDTLDDDRRAMHATPSLSKKLYVFNDFKMPF